MQRANVYITNAVKHFRWTPRGKRLMHKTPAQREIEACRYWLDQEFDSVGPQLIVAPGAIALKAVLDDSGATFQAVLGQTLEHDGRLVVPTYHSSYALRAPDPTTRAAAYDAIVTALRRAEQLLQRHRRPRSRR